MAKSRAKSKGKSWRVAATPSGRGRGRPPKGSPSKQSNKPKQKGKPLEIKVSRSRGKKDAWESRAVFSASTSGTMFRSIGVNTDPVEFAQPEPKSPKRTKVKVPKNEPLLQKVVTYMRTFNHARALSALLSSPSVKTALPGVVEVEVRKEVQRFVKKPLSFPSPQIVATGDKTHRITESAWGHILAEFKKEMPVFYMACLAALAPKNKQYTVNNPDSYEASNRGRLGMMMTIPLFARRERKFQYLSSLIGGQLWRHGCRQRIFHELYRLGVSQRRHGSMDAARWLEGETTKGNRIMKEKYQIMDEAEALQNGVLPSAERYETSDDEASSESDEDESDDEEVEEESDIDSEEDLLEESDEEDEIMAKPERVRGRGKRGQHQQIVIEEAVMDDNWQNDGSIRKNTSEQVISEMKKITQQMSETSQMMKKTSRRKKTKEVPNTEEVTVLSQGNNQIILQVGEDGKMIPISESAAAAAGMPIMVSSTGQDGSTVNFNQIMMGGIPTQIVQQGDEEMNPELMAAQLLQHVLPTEIVTTTQSIPQEVVTTTTTVAAVPPEGIQEEVVTIEAQPTSDQGEVVTDQQTIVSADMLQEQIIQEIIPDHILQQEVVTMQEGDIQEVQEVTQEQVVEAQEGEVILEAQEEEMVVQEGVQDGEITQHVVPAEIITTDGSGEMTTVVVTTEVVTTDDGETQVVMVSQDQPQTPKKRPAESISSPEQEGKRKRKQRAPYSP